MKGLGKLEETEDEGSWPRLRTLGDFRFQASRRLSIAQ
jgi:hypothetical protein